MFKRFALTFALVLGLALPVSAETSGVYAGLKFIDSIQSTGDMSKDRVDVEGFGFGIGSHSQNTVGGGIFVGYDFYPQHQVPIRTEIEYAIRSEMYKSWNKSHSVEGETLNLDAKARSNFQTLFFNAYWDFHNSTAFTPYIGAGVGLGFINNHYKGKGDYSQVGYEGPDSVSMNNMNTVFAWNVGAGCSYAFNENFSADLAYRFVGLGYNETSKTFYEKENGQKVKIGTSPYANEFSLGLRYTF